MKNRGASMCVFAVMKSGYFVICDDYLLVLRSKWACWGLARGTIDRKLAPVRLVSSSAAD